MTINDAREIVYTAFATYMGTNYPDIPYTFENEAFDSDEVEEWVRLVVHQTGGGQHTLGGVGNRVFRRRGIVLAQIYVKVDQGLLRLDELGEAILDLFEGTTQSQVMFHNGQYLGTGSYGGSWFRGTTQVAFTFDKVK